MDIYGAADHPVLAFVLGVLWLMCAFALAAVTAVLVAAYAVWWFGQQAWLAVTPRYRYQEQHGWQENA